MHFLPESGSLTNLDPNGSRSGSGFQIRIRIGEKTWISQDPDPTHCIRQLLDFTEENVHKLV